MVSPAAENAVAALTALTIDRLGIGAKPVSTVLSGTAGRTPSAGTPVALAVLSIAVNGSAAAAMLSTST